MTKLVILPIPSEQFHAHEYDVQACSEMYDMNGVTQINKICEVIDDEVKYEYPLYSIQRNNDGYHYLFLDRSEFQLQSINQVLSYCRLWVQTESIEDVIHYNNR